MALDEYFRLPYRCFFDLSIVCELQIIHRAGDIKRDAKQQANAREHTRQHSQIEIKLGTGQIQMPGDVFLQPPMQFVQAIE